jgi:hypothetical protein
VEATRETVCNWESSSLVDVDSFTMDTSRKGSES